MSLTPAGQQDTKKLQIFIACTQTSGIMGACCFKPNVSEDAVEMASAGGAGAGDRGRRANRAPRGGPPDAPGPGNKQLCRKPPVWSSERPMTKGQLLSKRDEFWDTAPAFGNISCRPIWDALRHAAECEDAETAQAIMSAIDVTLPHGNLSVVYDQLGNKYDIPPYCLSEPVNLVKTDSEVPGGNQGNTSATEDKSDSDSAPVAPPADLRVKLRLSTNQQLLWNGPPSTNIATLKAFVAEKEGVTPERQRWLFGGQMLPDSQTLAGAKVPADAVVQVMVRPEETPP